MPSTGQIPEAEMALSISDAISYFHALDRTPDILSKSHSKHPVPDYALTDYLRGRGLISDEDIAGIVGGGLMFGMFREGYKVYISPPAEHSHMSGLERSLLNKFPVGAVKFDLAPSPVSKENAWFVGEYNEHGLQRVEIVTNGSRYTIPAELLVKD